MLERRRRVNIREKLQGQGQLAHAKRALSCMHEVMSLRFDQAINSNAKSGEGGEEKSALSGFGPPPPVPKGRERARN